MHFNPQYVVLFHHFRRFLTAAADVGIDVAPLKGAHLLTSIYPNDEDRGMLADVDFLVRPEHFEKAGELLEELGFYHGEEHFPEVSQHEAAYYFDIDDDRSIMFEVHCFLFDPIRFPIDHNGLWARSERSDFEGIPCRRLAPEDHFVHIAFHAGLHRLMILERTLRDIELLVRNGRLDLDAVVTRAREWKTTRVVWLILKLVDKACPDLGLGSFARRLAPALPIRTALGLLVPDGSTSTRLSGMHHRLQAGLLWMWIFDSPVQVARFVVTHPFARQVVAKTFPKNWSIKDE
ncbi:MAG: nucleotidyltransferase family protein [Proteobacteria bacterium]|nr:nucleotidyltransferase family protein [Pseudomonadota bacterium]